MSKESRLSPGAYEWLRQNESVIRALFSGFRIPVDEDNVNAWFVGLGDLLPENLAVAVARALRECKSFVTPPQVRSFAVSTGVMTDEQRAEWAWTRCREAIRRVGAYDSIDFSDRLTNATIRMICSWVELCATTTEELTWRGKEFQRLYQMVARNGVGDGSPLLGEVAIGNGLNAGHAGPCRQFDCRLMAHPVARLLTYNPLPSAPALTHQRIVKYRRVIGVMPPMRDEDEPTPKTTQTDRELQKERLQIYGRRLENEKRSREQGESQDG